MAHLGGELSKMVQLIRGGVEDTRLEAKAKDTKKIRSPIQGQTLSRPRTQVQVFSSKKRSLQIFFQAIYKILTIQKIALSSSRGQGNFRGLEALKPRTTKCVLEAKNVLEDCTTATH